MTLHRRRGAFQRLQIQARWNWRRLERAMPAWLRRSLPWGSSLLAHVALLFVMAVAIRFASEPGGVKPPSFDPVIGQLKEDVTSLHDSDHAGDSFTSIRLDEPPSMPLNPADQDPTITAVAEMPDSVQLGPELNLATSVEPGELAGEPGLLGAATGSAPGSGAGGGPNLTSPILGRSKETRGRLVRTEGGTVESERAVERGLDWIARHQRPDGGWGLDCSPTCTPPGCPARMSMNSDVAATGLALLPLLAAGHTHVDKGRYQLTVRRGLAWLLSVQEGDGMMYTGGEGNSLMYSHCIATMVVCELYALTKDKSLKLPAEGAVGFILRAQHTLGGWRYNPMEPGDTCVFGWAIFALRSANIAGIAIPKLTLRGAAKYLDDAASDPTKATYGYQPAGGATPTMTAEGLVCRQLLGWKRDNPAMVKGVEIVFQQLQSDESRNIYYWYYATQLLHNMRDEHWPQWNQKVRETLIAQQVKGNGCDRGSWDPEAPSSDLWGSKAGRLYTTSLSLLTLEVYYRYLPLYRDQGGSIENEPTAGAGDDADSETKEDATKEDTKPATDGLETP